jgi:Kef-type K+ transport system membrane component KefB/Trk K+ transport system NAD-binding subunit
MLALIPNIILDFNFVPLLIVVFIAWFIPFTLSLLKIEKIPAVLLEMVAGYIVGRFVLHLVKPDSLLILDFLALCGLVFIMFLSGLEIDVHQIISSFPKKINRKSIAYNPLLSGVVHYIICLAISYTGTYLLSFYVEIPNVWFFSLIPTTTFMGIVYPVLKNRRETKSYFGQTVITTAAVADIFSITLVTFTSLYLKFGLNYQLLAVIAFFMFVLTLYFIGKRFSPGIFRKITFQQSHAATQIGMRGSILLVLLFVVISQLVGGEVVILGAFLSGVLLSFFMNKDRSILIIKLEGMGFGFFIPVFFIMVGAKFNPVSLLEFKDSLLGFLVMLTILFYLVKIVPSYIWIKRFGPRLSLAAGFLLAAHLGLVIAASSVGLKLGAITPGANASFIIMVVITCFASPFTYNLINKKQAYSDGQTIIVGGSSIGVLLARRLKLLGKTSIIIENNPERYAEMRSKGLDVFFGDGTLVDTFRKVNLSNGSYVVVLTGNNEVNLEICEMIRKDFRHERIISIPPNAGMEERMKSLGVEILDSRRILASTIEGLILRPRAIHALIETYEHFTVEDITVEKPEMEGRMVMELSIPKDAMLMLVTRGTEKFVPHGDTYLRSGDILTVFGTGTAIRQIREVLTAG